MNNVGQLNFLLWYQRSCFRSKTKQKVPSTFFATTAGYWSLVEETLVLLEKSFLRRSSVTFICSRAAISNSTIGLFGYRFCQKEKSIKSHQQIPKAFLMKVSHDWERNQDAIESQVNNMRNNSAKLVDLALNRQNLFFLISWMSCENMSTKSGKSVNISQKY